MATSFYIYYRVARTAGAGARAAVEAMQARLEAETGVRGRLLQKLDEPALWMEIYEQVGDIARFESILAALLDEGNFASFLEPDSRRTIERFTDACA